MGGRSGLDIRDPAAPRRSGDGSGPVGDCQESGHSEVFQRGGGMVDALGGVGLVQRRSTWISDGSSASTPNARSTFPSPTTTAAQLLDRALGMKWGLGASLRAAGDEQSRDVISFAQSVPCLSRFFNQSTWAGGWTSARPTSGWGKRSGSDPLLGRTVQGASTEVGRKLRTRSTGWLIARHIHT